MLLRIVQPLLMICNQLGDVVGVRVVRLHIDAQPDYMLFSNARPSDKAKKHSEELLYTSFVTLKINKIIKESIHTISLTDMQHDVNLRRLVCRKGEILKGACHLPIQAYTGTVANAQLHAVIGSVDGGRVLDIQRIYDYKGTAYTLEEFKTKEPNAQLQMKRLTERHVCCYDRHASENERECFCCWTNSPNCNCAMSCQHNRFAFVLCSEAEVRQYEASKMLVNDETAQNTEITRSSSGYVYRVSNMKGIDTVRVPSFCLKTAINTTDDTPTWKLIAHANMRHLEMETKYLPQRADLGHLYTFNIEARNGDAAVILPKLMTSAPWGYGSKFIFSMEDPFASSNEIDFASWLYDCSLFNVTLGRNPWGNVHIPGAIALSYTGTVVTRNFMLTIHEPQKKYYFTSDGNDLCTIGLGMNAARTERILLTWRHTEYQRIAVCTSNTELCNKQTQVVLNFEKPIAKRLHLDVTTEQVTTVRAPYIEVLEYYQMFLSGKRGDTHVYSRVNTLVICLNNASAYSDLYLYEGVKNVALVFMGDLALVNEAQRAQRLKQQFEESGPRIHVPKGTIARLREIKDEQIFAWTSTYYLSMYPKQRYTSCTDKPLSNTLHTTETKLSVLRDMFVEDL